MSFKNFMSGFAIIAILFVGSISVAAENENAENVSNNEKELPVNPVVNADKEDTEVDEASFDKDKKHGKHSHGKHEHGKRGHGHHHEKGHHHSKGHPHGKSKTFMKMALLKLLMGESPGHHGFGHGHHGMRPDSRMGKGDHGFSFFERMHGDKKVCEHCRKGHDKGRKGRGHHESHGRDHHGMHGFGHHELSPERAAIMGRTLLLYSEIKFTKEQKNQFKELFKTHHKNRRNQHKDLFKKFKEIMTAAAEGKSEEEIKKAGEELGSAIANAAINKTNIQTEARKILMEDQLKKIDETKAANDKDKKKMRENMKKKMEKIKAKIKAKKEKKEKASDKEKKA